MTKSFESAEESAMRRFLLDPSVPPSGLVDDLHLRLVDAVTSDSASAKDVTVLIRQWIRRISLRDKDDYRCRLAGSIEERILGDAAASGVQCLGQVWKAAPYQPDWLDAAGPIDSAAMAGSYRGQAQVEVRDAADPFFTRLTGWPTYRTPGQKVAARAAMTVANGSTLITLLPTGSGKTEVALCVAERLPGGVTLIVVPTVALALDFERRFQDHYAKLSPRLIKDKSSLRFAWTADTPSELREAFRNRLWQGHQPILVTSPESVTGALQSQLLELAGMGRLSAIVIDEAHLVTHWGRTFRPEFRALARLRADLLQRAESNARALPITLLMSATLSSYTIMDLSNLFGDPGPCTLVAANALRPEPTFWVAPESDGDARRGRVLEALDHLPRPAVLYVTLPEEALAWAETLRGEGYSRVAAVTGLSTTEERRDVLWGLRAGGESDSKYDLVVATSAFGLGIDYGHIRSVVHACVPETVDRWYQEVGRSGRDGDVSVTVFCPASDDWKVAEKLTSPTILLAATAFDRWKDLWRQRRERYGHQVLDLDQSRIKVEEGSYNLRWNNQLVQALCELHALETFPVMADDARVLEEEMGEKYRTWFSADLLRQDLDEMAWWHENWTPWRARELARTHGAIDRLRAVVNGDIRVCAAISEEYRASSDVIAEYAQSATWLAPEAVCGRCPRCRSEGEPPFIEVPPRPPQRWIPDDVDATRLRRFIEDCGVEDGLAVIVAPDLAVAKNQLVIPLLEAGVRHFAGCNAPVAKTTVFHDPSPIEPPDLSPLPAAVFFEDGDLRFSSWFNRTQRQSNRLKTEYSLDVLLVSEAVQLPRGIVTRNPHVALSHLVRR
jgi:ATP-dependent DNA helicase RecQ